MNTELLTIIGNIPPREEILKSHFNTDYDEERNRLANEVIEWLNSPKELTRYFDTFHNSHDELINALTEKGYTTYIAPKYFDKGNPYNFIVYIGNDRT